ncbi:MAG: peptidase, partial [Deltaproteobacteria bacterium]|nr:peptidase [Deltaproteobacteria bacterium]
GVYDRLDHETPFIGDKKRPEGAGFYPEDLSKEEFEKYIPAHPDEKDALESPFTVIKRDGDRLKPVYYHDEYKRETGVIVSLLREAAGFAENRSLRRYLVTRADDLLKDEYYQSDCDWLDLDDPVLDFIIGPYEVYEDNLMGLKAAHEAVIMIKDAGESEKLLKYIAYLDGMEQNLPVQQEFKRPAGVQVSSPLTVVNSIYRTGEAGYGYQFVAFNLPNDPKVREEKGAKKVMHRNFLEARLNKIILPVAANLLEKDEAASMRSDGFFNFVLLHEIAHSLGLNYVAGTTTGINQALKETYPHIEEAKADTTGMVSFYFLVDRGVIDGGMKKITETSFIGSLFRSIRFGGEAHATAARISLNYYLEKGAVAFDPGNTRFSINHDVLGSSIRDLSSKLLTVESKGDYAGAKEIIGKYGVMSPALNAAVKKVANLPIDLAVKYVLSS